MVNEKRLIIPKDYGSPRCVKRRNFLCETTIIRVKEGMTWVVQVVKPFHQGRLVCPPSSDWGGQAPWLDRATLRRSMSDTGYTRFLDRCFASQECTEKYLRSIGALPEPPASQSQQQPQTTPVPSTPAPTAPTTPTGEKVETTGHYEKKCAYQYTDDIQGPGGMPLGKEYVCGDVFVPDPTPATELATANSGYSRWFGLRR